MEIRANYILVGISTLVAALLCLAFLLWMGRSSSQSMVFYDVKFPSAVSGIGIGTDVLFLGIRVGSIQDIWIDPETLAGVRVRIEVAEGTPVRADTSATIEMRGITGGFFLQLRSHSTHAPLLESKPDAIPEIQGAASSMERISNTAPGLLNSAHALLSSLGTLATEENLAKITNTLTALDSLTARLDAYVAGDLPQTTRRVGEMAGSVGAMAQDFSELAGRLGELSSRVSALTSRTDALVAELEPGLNRFTGDGLAEFQRLLADLRRLVTTFDQLGRKIESDPSRFLFGKPVPEYTP